MSDNESAEEAPTIPVTEDPENILKQFVHEIRAPIYAIQGWSTLILKNPAASREAAEQISKIVANMQIVHNAVINYLKARSTAEK